MPFRSKLGRGAALFVIGISGILPLASILRPACHAPRIWSFIAGAAHSIAAQTSGLLTRLCTKWDSRTCASFYCGRALQRIGSKRATPSKKVFDALKTQVPGRARHER